MATRTEVIRTDDLTGEVDPKVVNWTFALAGEMYEVDLGEASYQKLVKALQPFINAGRPVKPAKSTGARPPRPSEANTAGHVRAWARSQGIKVPPRGRVPKDVVAQWEQAGSPS